MSRRLRTAEVQRLLAKMEQHMAELNRDGLITLVDGKPLTVGCYSKDPDASWGRVGRGWANGYKFHAIYSNGPIPVSWEVTPANEGEPLVAARLIPFLRRGGGYLVGDSAYDSNSLYNIAAALGWQLVAKRKRPKAGLGHRRHSPSRLRSIALLQQEFGKALYSMRTDIERQFGWLTNHAGGLAPLPNWVRRSTRVQQWIQAKLLVHSVYTYLTRIKKSLATA